MPEVQQLRVQADGQRAYRGGTRRPPCLAKAPGSHLSVSVAAVMVHTLRASAHC